MIFLKMQYSGIDNIAKIHGIDNILIKDISFFPGPGWYKSIKTSILNTIDTETFYVLHNIPDNTFNKLVDDIYATHSKIIYMMFRDYEVSYDITKCKFVYKHELVLNNKSLYDMKDRLPKISIKDMMVRIMRFKAGDIIRIKRPDGNYYRIVTSF